MWKRVALALVPAALIALVAAPILIDQPFGSQSPRVMAAAFVMRRWSPLVSGLGVVAILALVATGWRWSTGTMARAGLVLSLALTVGAAWFARQNPFEWMFHPLPGSRYVAAADATFVTGKDLVLAVTMDDDAAAYPIRQLAYHHVINDRIGRTPAVVTY